MCKHVETFYANKGYKFYSNFAISKIETYGTLSKRYLQKNEFLHAPIFYMKMNHFNIAFQMT